MSKILVAEDNLPNRELIREILETCGHEVIEAEDGQQALDKLEHIHPDLVLLDIQMPVLDGYAVVRRLRQIPRFASLKVLALTAYAMQGDREKVLKSGFDGYLTTNRYGRIDQRDRSFPRVESAVFARGRKKGQEGSFSKLPLRSAESYAVGKLVKNCGRTPKEMQ